MQTYDKKILEGDATNVSELPQKWGRTTNVQFVFTDDKLTSWEEDKLTLSMAMNGGSKSPSFSYYVSILLNIIIFHCQFLNFYFHRKFLLR